MNESESGYGRRYNTFVYSKTSIIKWFSSFHYFTENIFVILINITPFRYKKNQGRNSNTHTHSHVAYICVYT